MLLFFVDFLLHPLNSRLEKEGDEMFVRPFGTDLSEGIDVFGLALLGNDDNGMSGFMQDEIGKKASDASITITERMEVFIKTMETGC